MRTTRAQNLGNSADVRRRIAVEAARLIAEQGLRDYHAAKLKAASHLGLGATAPLPRNAEIETALREHQRLFKANSQPQHLLRLRDTAIEAMRFLAPFEPRLVGATLDGTADEYSSVCLHVFTDSLSELSNFLEGNGIPFDQQDRHVRLDSSRSDDFPVLLFSAGGVPIDLTVFPLDGLRQSPMDRIVDRPMRRVALDTLLKQLQVQDSTSS